MIEILVVVVIMSLLLSLVIPLTGHFRRKGQDAVCISNLRSLHSYFSGYLLDHAMIWPQLPEALESGDGGSDDNDQLAEFWIKTLEPYGAHRDTWLCPSERTTFADDFSENAYNSSYIVTSFDNTPNIAYQWAKQPWLIERGGFHSGDANRVLPDGSIQKDYMPFPAK